MALDHLSEPVKHAFDGLSIGVTLGALAQWLPSIASLLTVIWLAIRIWESDTVRGLTGRPLLGIRRDD
jgi:peptidoglycan biosynthesis protein MviN/MurJ (putative lipid II flippase)